MGALTGDFVFVGDVGAPTCSSGRPRSAGDDGGRRAPALRVAAALPRAARLSPDLAGPRRRLRLRQVARRGAAIHARLREAAPTGRSVSRTRRSSCAAVLDGQPDPPRYFAVMKSDQPRRAAGCVNGRPDRSGFPPTAGPGAGRGRRRGRHSSRPGLCARAPFRARSTFPGNRSFTTWAGWLLPYDRDIYLIAGNGRRTRARGDRRESYRGSDSTGSPAISTRSALDDGSRATRRRRSRRSTQSRWSAEAER